MQRGQFTFYRSFWNAMQKLSPEDQLLFVTAICAYAFEEECRPLTGAAAAAFLLVQPVLDTARRRAASGQLGGSRPKAKRKQTASEGEKDNEMEKENELEEELEVEKDFYRPAPLRGAGGQKRDIPDFPLVMETAESMGCPEIAQAFYDYYAVAGWRDSEGKLVLDWRQKLVAWKARAADNVHRPFARLQNDQKKSWAALAAELDGEA